MNIPFQFRKIAQAINFFAKKSPDKTINVTKVVKLIWGADRYHFRKYGTLLTGDTYFAMKRGPVGSTVKNIAEEVEDALPGEVLVYSSQIVKHRGNDTHSVGDLDLKIFSETELEALKFSLDHFFSIYCSDLVDLSHKYPEWKKHEQRISSGLSRREDIDYLDFFNDPSPKDVPIDHFKINSEIIVLNKEIFTEERSAANQF